METFRAPIPAFVQRLATGGHQPPKISEALIQAVCYGGIAAFTGKVFTPINPAYAALYGVIRGGLDPLSGNFLFDAFVGDKENMKNFPPATRYFAAMLESAASMLVVWGALKLCEYSIQGVSNLTSRIQPIANPLELKHTLCMEFVYGVSIIALFQLKLNGE